MLPVIAIVGRPNVGKSTLFNRLTQSRAALVADYPGLTRDRQYGNGTLHGRSFIVIDTGGIGVVASKIQELMYAQAKQAIHEADAIIFLVDARSGLTVADQTIAQELRKITKPIYLVINKIDGVNVDLAQTDFFELGFSKQFPISATHGNNINPLLQIILDNYSAEEIEQHQELFPIEEGIKVAVIGRPNVGKSTLVNRMLGEERVIVYDQAGTTRDSIYIPFTRFDKNYTLIDTAGVRRRGRVFEAIEKFSIVKTLKAIEDAHVVVFLIDAQENVVEQDLHLLGYILEAGKALVLAVNKWDGLSDYQKQHIKHELERRLRFIDFAELFFISALHGTNVGHLYKSIDKAYKAAFIDVSTKKATEILFKAVAEHQPPMVHGHRIKLRHAHMGGHNPPIFVIHGNQTESIPLAYRRYLMNYYQHALKLVGTPVQLEFKSSINPYKGRKNPLTERQIKKRRRLIKHAKN